LQKEVKGNCHLSEKVEEDQKEAKEAAASFNVLIAVQWYLATRPRETLAGFHLLNLN
jgi:hypothetical protein